MKRLYFDNESFKKDLTTKRVGRPQRYMGIRVAAKEIGIEWGHLYKIESGVISNPGISTFLLCCTWLGEKPSKYCYPKSLQK